MPKHGDGLLTAPFQSVLPDWNLVSPEFQQYARDCYWSHACGETLLRRLRWEHCEPSAFAVVVNDIADALAVVDTGNGERWRFAKSPVPNVPRLRTAARRAARDLKHDPVFLAQDTTSPLATVANTVVAYIVANRPWVERLLAEDPTGGALVFALLGNVMLTVKNAIRGRRASDGARVNLMRPNDAIPNQTHGEVCEESGLVSWGVAPWEVSGTDKDPGKES